MCVCISLYWELSFVIRCNIKHIYIYAATDSLLNVSTYTMYLCLLIFQFLLAILCCYAIIFLWIGQWMILRCLIALCVSFRIVVFCDLCCFDTLSKLLVAAVLGNCMRMVRCLVRAANLCVFGC